MKLFLLGFFVAMVAALNLTDKLRLALRVERDRHQKTRERLQMASDGWRNANKRTADLLLRHEGIAPAFDDYTRFKMDYDDGFGCFFWVPEKVDRKGPPIVEHVTGRPMW